MLGIQTTWFDHDLRDKNYASIRRFVLDAFVRAGGLPKVSMESYQEDCHDPECSYRVREAHFHEYWECPEKDEVK